MASKVRHGRAFWEKTVRDFEGSDQTHGAFAQSKGVTVGALRHWLYKLRHEGQQEGDKPIRLVPVTVTSPTALEVIEVGVEGAVLRFRAGTDAGYIAGLVHALREWA